VSLASGRKGLSRDEDKKTSDHQRLFARRAAANTRSIFKVRGYAPLLPRTPISFVPLMASHPLRLHKEAACGVGWRDFVKPQAVRLLRQDQRACKAETHPRTFTMESV
jgi:hypothetical protein